jgi:hypothetical protein
MASCSRRVSFFRESLSVERHWQFCRSWLARELTA